MRIKRLVGPYHHKSQEPGSLFHSFCIGRVPPKLYARKEDGNQEVNLFVHIYLDLTSRYLHRTITLDFSSVFRLLPQKANLMKFPHLFWKWQE